ELAAAALLTESSGIVEYHLAATADAHVHASPSKLLIRFAETWARSRGNTVLHLAGSLSRGDTLEHFKLGFSPRVHPMLSWRVVVDPEAYERLSGGRHGIEAGYFPAYRRPPERAGAVRVLEAVS
ncbi:MAG TPA: hypothetical protein VFR93_10100, partial [Candidatus Limnocylindrales bacterium]|nr:hypothetical protein [Candidatus Limnocylindrales bacterium]